MNDVNTVHVPVHYGDFEGIRDLQYWEQWVAENVTSIDNFNVDFSKDSAWIGLITFKDPNHATIFRLTAPEYIERKMLSFKKPVNISANWFTRK